MMWSYVPGVFVHARFFKVIDAVMHAYCTATMSWYVPVTFFLPGISGRGLVGIIGSSINDHCQTCVVLIVAEVEGRGACNSRVGDALQTCLEERQRITCSLRGSSPPLWAEGDETLPGGTVNPRFSYASA